jgi:hypothetical protein
MPAILPRETWSTWLGETDAPLEEVKGLLLTYDDDGWWTMTPQQPSRASRPPKPPSKQGSCSSGSALGFHTLVLKLQLGADARYQICVTRSFPSASTAHMRVERINGGWR